MKYDSKRFSGGSIHRLLDEDNMPEKVYHEAWVDKNCSAGNKYSMLEMLLSEDGGYTPADVSERDEMVAATIIQWLGSPVGESFVAECLENIEKKRKEERKSRAFWKKI